MLSTSSSILEYKAFFIQVIRGSSNSATNHIQFRLIRGWGSSTVSIGNSILLSQKSRGQTLSRKESGAERMRTTSTELSQVNNSEVLRNTFVSITVTEQSLSVTKGENSV